ncbi:MAG: hypothetical protein F4X20_08115 [Dehalococcoidia bacterium]|nr:hypothetical protein [Dehalococcoidia bacterium]
MTTDPKTPLPDGWHMVALGDVAKIIMGQSPPGSTVSDWDGELEEEPGLPFIQGNAEFGARSPTAVKWCATPLKIAEPGDTLLSVRAPVGATNRAECELAIGRGLAAVRFNDSQTPFGWHIVNHAKYELDRLTQGSTFSAIGSDVLRSLPIPLPPLEEQRGIATVLDTIDEAIERSEAIIAATERLHDALLHELLTRGVPGRHSEYRDVPVLGTIPASWEAAQLGEVATINRGLSWSRDQELPAAEEGSTPVVRIGNVQRDGFKMDDVLHIKGVSSQELERHQISDNHLIMVGSNGNPDRVGNLYLANNEVVGHVMASFLIGIKPFKGVATKYLDLSLSSWRPQRAITESTSGSTGLRNLSLEFLRSLRVALPPLPEQEEIAEALDGVEASIAQSKAQADTLRSLKASAAEALLTGTVRVRGK